MNILKFLIIYIMKAIPVVTVALDYRMEKKQISTDTTLTKELTTLHKTENIIAYILIVASLLFPYRNGYYLIALVFSFAVSAYYLWCSDKRVYIGRKNIYLRGKEYAFKTINKASYENDILLFNTKDQTIKMKHPQLSKVFIEKKFINEINKRIFQKEQTLKKRKNRNK